ncbi:MAG: SpoVR family protein [Peptococcaceae bacterium]|jgi:stage V sporulation protein R|nr:SpoVR family protein [Peptococcaceae bacterium]
MTIDVLAGEIWDAARELGLDPHPVHFEVVPHHVLYEVAAYGLPNHFRHWTYGRNYWIQKQQYEHGLARIYELVINSDPAYAYILQNNSDVQKAFVMAHVMGHSHVFKCNWYWKDTRKDMPQYMAAAAARFAGYEQVFGETVVEGLIDKGLSLQFHVADEDHEPVLEAAPRKRRTEFDGLFGPDPGPGPEDSGKPRNRVPPGHLNRLPVPTEDLLGYIIRYSPVLTPWETDVLSVIRQEGIYFKPYYGTKLLHEGFAVWTHQKILGMLDLSQEDRLEAAVTHAGVSVPHQLGLNPYYLGWRMLEMIEREKGPGEVLKIAGEESDSSFIRNHLTREMVEELDLYRWVKREERDPGYGNGYAWVVEETGWEEVRDFLSGQYARPPLPVIEAVAESPDQRGELVLWQVGDEDMDRNYAEKTLGYVTALWGGDVKLGCNLNGGRGFINRRR